MHRSASVYRYGSALVVLLTGLLILWVVRSQSPTSTAPLLPTQPIYSSEPVNVSQPMPVELAKAGQQSIAFEPSTLALSDVGSSATVSVLSGNVSDGISGLQLDLVHPDSLNIADVACAGIFEGAFPVSARRQNGTRVACLFPPPDTVRGSAGNVLTFTVARTGPGDATIALDPDGTMFVGASMGLETPTALGTLTVTGGEPLPIESVVSTDS